MISLCRICLTNISIEDKKSKRLIDFYTFYKPKRGICNISFLTVVSSCLPDLNLHIPIDSMPRVCGSCCSKIIDLYSLKQQSLGVEKILLQYIKFHNNSEQNVKNPVKLSDVASMYNSVHKNQNMTVTLVDLLKQLYAASTNDKNIESTDIANGILHHSPDLNNLNADALKTAIKDSDDAVILVVEKNGENNNIVYDLKRVANFVDNFNKISAAENTETNAKFDKKPISAETWFKISQANLLPNNICRRIEIRKSTYTIAKQNEEVSKATNNSQKLIQAELLTSPEDDKKLPSSKTQSDNEQPNPENSTSIDTPGDTTGVFPRKGKKRNMRKLKYKRTLVKISSGIVSPFRQLKTTKNHRRKTMIKIKNKTAHERFSTEFVEKEPSETINEEQIQNNLFLNHAEEEVEENNGKKYYLEYESNNTVQCNICGTIFLNESELYVHLCCTTTVQCEVCNVLFASESKWKQHDCKTHTTDSWQGSNNLPQLPQQFENDYVTTAFLPQFDDEESFAPYTRLESPMDESSPDNFICEICDMDFFTKVNFTEHVAVSHVSIADNSADKQNTEVVISDEEIIPVPQTLHMKYISPSKLNNHFFTAPKSNEAIQFTCNYCSLIYANESLLISHLKQHKGWLTREVFQCDECEKQFHHAHLLRRHKNIHSPRQCLICAQSFALSHNFRAHMLWHSINDAIVDNATIDEAPIVIAPISNVTTSTFQESMVTPSIMIEPIVTAPVIVEPIVSASVIVEPIVPPSIIVEPIVAPLFATETFATPPLSPNIKKDNYRCDKCDESFKNEYELHFHAEDHMIDIKFKCEVCAEVFPSRPAYRIHKTTHHAGDLQNIESRTLQTRSDSESNVDDTKAPLHPVRKRYGNTVFTKRSSYSQLYECRICLKKFISQKFLFSHFRNHIKKPPYFHQCKDCGAGFAKIFSLRRHMALNHRKT